MLHDLLLIQASFMNIHFLHLGTKVVEVRATDADDPTTANGELRYSLIQDGGQATFKIDSVTGGYNMIVTLQKCCLY